MPPMPPKYSAVVRLRKQAWAVKDIAWRLDMDIKQVHECIAHFVLRRREAQKAAKPVGPKLPTVDQQRAILEAVRQLHGKGTPARVLLANFGDLVELHPAQGWKLKHANL